MGPSVLRLDAAQRATTQFAADGYALLEHGVSPAFMEWAHESAARLMASDAELPERRVPGKKRQYLFDFMEGPACPDDLIEAVARWLDVPNSMVTLSERLLKVYDPAAPATPPPHKDRRASQLSLGIPLKVPAGSYVALFVDGPRDENPFDSAAEYADSRPVDDWRSCPATCVDVQPGSALAFLGSRIYHERMHPAGTVILYLKFNGLGLDPLGHDARRTFPQGVGR